jgi:hypothetical protein
MKTTIEIQGYEIVIEENEGLISVSALKEGEVVEEFELEASDDEAGFEGEEEGDFDAAQELGEEEGEEEAQEEFEEGEEEGEEEAQEEFEEEGKLESFNSFIRKRK